MEHIDKSRSLLVAQEKLLSYENEQHLKNMEILEMQISNEKEKGELARAEHQLRMDLLSKQLIKNDTNVYYIVEELSPLLNN